jgi:hypothetical protein
VIGFVIIINVLAVTYFMTAAEKPQVIRPQEIQRSVTKVTKLI